MKTVCSKNGWIPRKQILRWTPPELKKPGTPKKSLGKEIKKAVSERGLNTRDWEDSKKLQLKTVHTGYISSI